jgi:pantetheine-phosphate adenylyltransferase
MKDKKQIAIVPGSFDPITYGHIDIVKRAVLEYDTVYLAVMINDSKKYMFDMSQREAIAKASLRDLPNVTVISSSGMLWELARDLDADAIVKGYRNQVDYEYEQKMAEYNSEHYPKAVTVLLRADEAFEELSSTVVRERIVSGCNLEGYLPQAAIKLIEEYLKKN